MVEIGVYSTVGTYGVSCRSWAEFSASMWVQFRELRAERADGARIALSQKVVRTSGHVGARIWYDTGAMKKMLVVTFALCALVASARTEDITVWRGETVTFILRDYLTIGSAPEGIAVKTGTAKEGRAFPLKSTAPTRLQRAIADSSTSRIRICGFPVRTLSSPL